MTPELDMRSMHAVGPEEHDDASGLAVRDFVPIALRGWGDAWNTHAHSMVWFEGHLYCGTMRAHMGLKRLAALREGWPNWPVWPIKCSDDVFEDVDMRAQIWRSDLSRPGWQLVHRSPEITGSHGKTIAREKSYRAMTVFQTRSDTKPVIYVSTHRDPRSEGPCILRSEDGESFETVATLTRELGGAMALRFLVPHKGKLYTSPIGGGTPGHIGNYAPTPMVFEADDPVTGTWRPVSVPGFGDPDNHVIFAAASVGEYLYAGTLNHAEGFQLWKTTADGTPPYAWEKVIGRGAYRGKLNQGVATLYPFGDALYVGTAIQHGGYDRNHSLGPAGAELIRVYPDDTWDLVVGQPRLTGEGIRIPTSGYGPGFDSLFNGYIWQMCAHEENLYVATMNNAILLRFIEPNMMSTSARELLEALDAEETIAAEGGFDLWCSADGDRWRPVTTNGFGNPYNQGGRTLVSTPHGLVVGTNNSFGPEVAVKEGSRWRYRTNSRGGIEIWLGSRGTNDTLAHAPPTGALDSDMQALSYRLSSSGRAFRPAYRTATLPEHEARDPTGAALPPPARRMEFASVLPKTLERARRYFDVTPSGDALVPKDEPVVFVSNKPLLPCLGAGNPSGLLANLLLLQILHEVSSRTVRLLLPVSEYESQARTRISASTRARLGWAPATVRNGADILREGHSILVQPEQRPSTPPYRTQPFGSDFIEMAMRAGAPIVPLAYLGPHESHIVVEHDGVPVLINEIPMLADYRVVFLAPISQAELVARSRQSADSAEIAESVHRRVQQALNAETRARPRVRLVRQLQLMYGTQAQ